MPDNTHPVALITTDAGIVEIHNVAQDTDHSTAWVLEGSDMAIALLLPHHVRIRCMTIRCLVQIYVVASRPKPS